MQKGRVPPVNMAEADYREEPSSTATTKPLKHRRLCSFDGDADRLVYHYYRPATGTAEKQEDMGGGLEVYTEQC